MSFVKKGTKVFSIFYNKCPRCNEGDFFYSHPYHLKKFGLKHFKCEVCHLKFEKEPGFFFGSMYVSYALGVGLFLVWWVIQSIFFPDFLCFLVQNKRSLDFLQINLSLKDYLKLELESHRP